MAANQQIKKPISHPAFLGDEPQPELRPRRPTVVMRRNGRAPTLDLAVKTVLAAGMRLEADRFSAFESKAIDTVMRAIADLQWAVEVQQRNRTD